MGDGTSGLTARIGWRPSSYDERVASARMRAFIPVRRLARAGVPASIIPPDGGGDYDCVVFQKAYAPADLRLAEGYRAAGVKVVLDLCDNHLWNPTGDPALDQRAARLHQMLDLADVVTVSTPAMATLVAPRPAVVVDDALELPRPRRLRHRGRPRPVSPVRLVWFGNAGGDHPPFGLVHLAPLVPELERLHRRLPLHLTVISNAGPLYDRHVGGASFPTAFVRWRRRTVHRALARHDICLLPIEPNPFTDCISANRPHLALLLGLPVVTSPVPSYQELASWVLFDDWAENIARYATDGSLVTAHVDGARDHIRRTYTDERLVEQWTAVLRATVDGAVGTGSADDRRPALPDAPR